jgi:SP family general alpha glucoside:H+ symporter-like MFS transporter
MEIAPNRIRGGLILFQAVWSNIGGIIVSLMMQQLNKKHPNDYLIAMRVLWAPIGLMILCWACKSTHQLTTFSHTDDGQVIPESPWFLARKGNKEGAMKALRTLFGNVQGYDFEEEYSIIERTIQHELDTQDHKPAYMDVFRGTNLVSPQTPYLANSKKRTLTVMFIAASGQLGGLAIVSTYSTCR